MKLRSKRVTAVVDEKSQAQKSEKETSKDETPKAQSSSESVESEANKSVTAVVDEKSWENKVVVLNRGVWGTPKKRIVTPGDKGARAGLKTGGFPGAPTRPSFGREKTYPKS